jgi:aldose 1-epimerase
VSARVELAGGPYSAELLPELGMAGCSLTHDGVELVALDGGLDRLRAGGATGIPLLAPWANRLSRRRFEVAGVAVDLEGVPLHDDGHGLPIHGTMIGERRWTVVEAEPAGVRARFAYEAPELLRAFPFPHVLELDVSVGPDGLRVETTLTAGEERPVPVAFGWHPYFRLPGPVEDWRLELPGCTPLELDSRGIPTGHTASNAGGTVRLRERAWDDLFALEGPSSVAVTGGGLRLEVRYGAGYPYAQVFSPAGADFVAIEPMTAATDALTRDECAQVEPGDTFRAVFEVAVSTVPTEG